MDRSLALRMVLPVIIGALCFSCTPESAQSESTVPVDTVSNESPVTLDVEEPITLDVKGQTAAVNEVAPAVAQPAPAEPQTNTPRTPVVTPEKPDTVKADSAPKVVVPAPVEMNDTTVVASIKGWDITGKELRERAYREVYPDQYDMTPRIEPVDLNDVTLLLLGEKALAMQAHEQGQHKEGNVATSLERYRTTLLIRQLMSQVVKEKDVQVSEAEVKAYQKIKPELDDARAKAMLMRMKGQKLAGDFIGKLRTSRHAQKKTENFAKAAALHQKLLLHPKEPRTNNVSWILRKQIQNELTPDQKKVVLATYDGGVFTVEDWFTALHQIAPPGRPKNLGTAKGVEQFLDRSLRQPLLRAEAIERGLDKDGQFIKSVLEREYSSLYNKVRSDMTKAVAEPNDQEVEAHYAAIKDQYGREDSLKAQIIWCENKAAALKAKAELNQGKTFAEVQAKYAVDKKNLEPRTLALRQEGMFWQEIWASEPNQVIGPMLGFREGKFGWRVIKTLEKERKDPKDLDENIRRTLQWEIRKDQVDVQLKERTKELLRAYPHKIYRERLKAFDPANTP